MIMIYYIYIWRFYRNCVLSLQKFKDEMREKINLIANIVFILSLVGLWWGFSILSAKIVFLSFIVMAISLVTAILSAPKTDGFMFFGDNDYVP